MTVREPDWYEYELPAVAQGMHSASIGASDMPQRDEAERLIRWMSMRLGGWRPSVYPAVEPFDAAVRATCELALSEFRKEHERRPVRDKSSAGPECCDGSSVASGPAETLSTGVSPRATAEALGRANELEAACWNAIGYPPGEDDAGHVETLVQAIAGLVEERDHLIDERVRLQYQIDGDEEIRIAEVMGRAALLRAIEPFVRAFRTERYGNGVSGHHWKTLFDAATEYETGKAPEMKRASG